MKAFSWLLKGSLLGLAFYAGLRYVPAFNLLSGDSMSPTIHDGDVVISNSTLLRNKIELGDIVVMMINQGHRRYLKRVVGVENMLAFFRSDVPYCLKEGEYWLEGDNTRQSYDSRDFGPVPEGRIIRKVTGVLCHHEELPSP